MNIDETAGGPYAHEIDAIRDERYRAARMKQEPDFEAVFADVAISAGAAQVIADINKPVELPIGEFVENVKYDAEEAETPESPSEEGSETTNPNYSEGTAPEETGAESGNGETPLEPETVDPERENDLQDAEELNSSPIYDSVVTGA